MHPAATFPSLPRPTPARGLALLLGLLAGIPALRADTPLNPAYSIVDLGTLGGSYSYGRGINNAGQVTGSSYTPGNSILHAFLYSNGIMSDLGTLGGSWSFGVGLNDAGQLTGYSNISGNTASHAFLYSNGVMTDLGTLGGPFSYSFDINRDGQIAGYSSTNTAAIAFTYSNGAMTNVGTLGGSHSIGYAINDSGQIAGSSYTTGGSTQHAFLYADGTMTDLGTLGGTHSYGYDINNTGQVTGYSYTTGTSIQHAFLYSDGVMTDLGTLGGTNSIGYGINDAGQITGVSHIAGDNRSHAFLYSGGVMHNLNDLVGTNPIATNITMNEAGNPINDWGQITAYGTVGGQPHALLLNPVDPLTSTTGDSRNTRFVEGMRYEQFTSTTRSGGFGTTVALLDGTVGSGGSVAYAQGGYGRNRDVNVTFAGATPPPDLSSDVITLTGTFADTYVLSLSYDESVHGDDVILGWRSGLNDWVTAFGGYTGLGITPVFFDRAYDPDTDFVLGYHGVDAGTHTVWAVLNLEGDFAVFSSAVPEPSCALLLLAGLSTLALRRRRQTDTRPLS